MAHHTQSHSQSGHLSSLSASVTSLRTSLSLLDSSIAILDNGISDFPRLKKVLSSTRHFELTPQQTLHAAQTSLATELAPAITTLLARAEAHVAKMERKRLGLVARSEQLEGRLESGGDNAGGRSGVKGYGGAGGGKGYGGGRGTGKGGKSAGSEERALRLKTLRGKKERLGYAVERLGLQSQQRQRQLRMSVAAAPVGDEE